MDVRRYLDVEAALHRKLRLAWRRQALSLWNRIEAHLERGEFGAARAVVDEVDFEAIGRQYRGWIKAMLWVTAMFGAKLVAKKPMLSVTPAEGLMSHVTDNFILILKYQITPVVRELALQAIANAEGEVRKAEAPVRYVRDFVTFTKAGDDKLKLVSSLHSSRLATWGFVAEADLMGITTYRLRAVLDGRTSEFCRAIDGKTFVVQDAKRSINTILMAQDPQDVKVLQPWPKQDAESIKAYRDMDASQLTSLGLHIPPFHPRCRTILMKLKADPGQIPPELEENYEPMIQHKFTPQTMGDFQSVGLRISPEELNKWNQVVGESPVKILADLFNVDPSEALVEHLVGAAGNKFFSFKKDGSITFNVTADLNEDGGTAVVKQVFDPLLGKLFLTNAEFKNASWGDAAKAIKNIYNGALKNAATLGADSFTVLTDGKFGLWSHSQFGFVPASAADWSNLRDDLRIDLADPGGRLAGLWAIMSNEEGALLKLILNTTEPKGLWAIGELPHGRDLLEDRRLPVSLSLHDPEATTRYRGHF